MVTQNLMEINSQHIGSMDTITEYQRLQINHRVGEYLKNNSINIKKNTQLFIKKIPIIKAWEKLELKYELYQLHDNRILIIDEKYIAELWWNYQSSYTCINMNIVASSYKISAEAITYIKKILGDLVIDKKAIEFTSIQYDNGNLTETFYGDIIDIDFNSLAVPFIDNVDKFIKDFINSNSSILILQGKPGTGKSTFTKYMLSQMQKYTYDILNEPVFKTLYSFDENIFYSPEFYNKLTYEEYDVIVLEDFNQLIHKNTDDQGGLNPLHKLLSVTDGILSKPRKIIITTNIDSKSQLHPALIRPGRCFDTVNFRNLEGVEIDDLCDSCAKDLELQIESISASEFYAKCNDEHNSSIVTNRVGF